MGRATIQDAFNAAAGLSQQVLETLTERKKYELDTKLFKQSIELERVQGELLADFTRIDETGGNIFQQNPEAYRKHISERLTEWRRNAKTAGNNSRYYLDHLERMDLQSAKIMGQQVNALEDRTTKQQTAIAYIKANASIDSAGWDIERTLGAKMANLKQYRGINALNPAEEYRERVNIANSALDQALNVNIDGMSISQAYMVIDNNLQTLETAFAPYLSEGETFDSFLEKKQERLADARQAVRLAIWKRDYNVGAALNAEYRRITHDGLESGNPILIRRAQMLWREGSQLREKALASIEGENPEYNPENKDEIASWFPIIGGLFDEGRSGSRSSSIVDRIKKSRDYWITSGAEGRSAMEAAKASFMQEMGELARELGYTIDELEHQYSEINFFGMYEDTKNALINKNPGYADAFESLDAFINTWKRQDNDPLKQALRERQGRRIAGYLFDKILDSEGTARMSPEEAQREELRIAGLLVSDDISFLRETVDNSNQFTVGSNSDVDFGKAIYAMSQHDWARFVANGQTYMFGDAKYLEGIENAALNKFSIITGIPKANLESGHSKEGPYDETAELNIIVAGSGEENGTYRFVSDARGNYHIERRTGNRWERYAGTAGEAEAQEREREREQHAEAVRQEEERTRQRNMDNIFDALKNEPDQHRRQQIISSAQAPGPYTIYSNDFWKAGINPNSGAAVTEIPARVWDDILRDMNAHEQEVQKNKWRQMGITRGGGNR